MTKTYDHVDVDLTALRKLACGLVPDIPIEFELVPLYSYVNKSNQFDKFTTIFLKKMYGIDVIEFSLLRECKNQIISQSTFGFWASFLNSNSDKIVVVPKSVRGNIWDKRWI